MDARACEADEHALWWEQGFARVKNTLASTRLFPNKCIRLTYGADDQVGFLAGQSKQTCTRRSHVRNLQHAAMQLHGNRGSVLTLFSGLDRIFLNKLSLSSSAMSADKRVDPSANV